MKTVNKNTRGVNSKTNQAADAIFGDGTDFDVAPGVAVIDAPAKESTAATISRHADDRKKVGSTASQADSTKQSAFEKMCEGLRDGEKRSATNHLIRCRNLNGYLQSELKKKRRRQDITSEIEQQMTAINYPIQNTRINRMILTAQIVKLFKRDKDDDRASEIPEEVLLAFRKLVTVDRITVVDQKTGKTHVTGEQRKWKKGSGEFAIELWEQIIRSPLTATQVKARVRTHLGIPQITVRHQAPQEGVTVPVVESLTDDVIREMPDDEAEQLIAKLMKGKGAGFANKMISMFASPFGSKNGVSTAV